MLEVKQSEVKKNYTVISVGYCSMQYLLHYEERHLYTCGVYGWNSHIYLLDSIGYYGTVISTGYRPVNGLSINYELLNTNEKKARDLINSNIDIDEKKMKVRALLEQCVKNALESRG